MHIYNGEIASMAAIADGLGQSAQTIQQWDRQGILGGLGVVLNAKEIRPDLLDFQYHTGPTVNGDTLVYGVSDFSLIHARADMLREVAVVRYNKEQGGIMWNGFEIPTTDRSKLLIDGLYRKAEKAPDAIHNIKVSTGVFVPLTSAQVIELGDAVAQHVQDQYDWEKEQTDLINAAQDLSELRTIRGWGVLM